MYTVYTSPVCAKCKQLMKQMDSLGIKYKSIDISKNPEALQFLKDRGHTSVPQVYVGGGCVDFSKLENLTGE